VHKDQVLHDGDVVSRSDGFGTTNTRTPVRRTMSINMWMSRSRLALNYSFCGNSFIRRRGLHDFSIRNVFITTLFYLEIFSL